jgi:hypothetical protein
VSSVLLDYIVLTALLLVTPLREWTRFSHQVRSIGGVSSAWGDGDGDGELESDEWEEPSRFRWGRSSSNGHGHQLGLGLGRQQQQQQQQQQDQRLRGGQCGDGREEVDEWAATSDEMREVANAALFTASRFTRRNRSIVTMASTDSSRTLVTLHPTAVAVPTTHTTGSSASHAQEIVRRALAMDLERELGDYPCGLPGGGGGGGI